VAGKAGKAADPEDETEFEATGKTLGARYTIYNAVG
jgi:hypothetical protein